MPSRKDQRVLPKKSMLTKIDKDRSSIFRSGDDRERATCLSTAWTCSRRTKEVARFMAEPSEASWIMLKRLVRYLVADLCKVISEQRYVKGTARWDTDSDYARCVLTRKSTTCAHLFHGVTSIKARSWTQGARKLSAAESEFDAGVSAKSMMIDFGENVAQCVSWYRQQFSQEYHGETWSRTDSTSTLSHALVTRTC